MNGLDERGRTSDSDGRSPLRASAAPHAAGPPRRIAYACRLIRRRSRPSFHRWQQFAADLNERDAQTRLGL